MLVDGRWCDVNLKKMKISATLITEQGGKSPANPVVEVVDKTGMTVYSAKLEYG